MRYLPVFALLATPAIAHEGAHIHPHGGEALTLLLLAIGAGAFWVLNR